VGTDLFLLYLTGYHAGLGLGGVTWARGDEKAFVAVTVGLHAAKAGHPPLSRVALLAEVDLLVAPPGGAS
jgi:hypothetical protein